MPHKVPQHVRFSVSHSGRARKRIGNQRNRQRATGDGPNISDIPGALFLPGGVPLESENGPIAGIGVGGAPDGAIDEEIAMAAVEVLENYEG
ncbi:heme-binding protein [Nocardiopsis exhalans]|uniref:Heme-binding protein n=1 Tax=Nocardiopsis exhalans TaxID=163604 RepID=A0ABY5D948_9ACTN|nr:heme-binding protein [Nocardiopsis exhalans]USY20043.1 heme-binding protein [Nocardiopsis exhalans]